MAYSELKPHRTNMWKTVPQQWIQCIRTVTKTTVRLTMTIFIAEQFQDVSQVTSFLQRLYHIKMNYSIVLNIIYKRN
jgi:hypothetical protein